MLMTTGGNHGNVLVLRKDERYVTIADAVAVVETFAEQTQQRRVRIQQRPARLPAALSGAPADHADDASSSSSSSTAAGAAAAASSAPGDSVLVSSGAAAPSSPVSPNVVVLECENAPECKWFVRLSYIKSEKKWKISSMNTVHHKTNCAESSAAAASAAAVGATARASAGSAASLAAIQRLAAESAAVSASPATTATPDASTAAASTAAATAAALGAHWYVGLVFISWKEAIFAVRALAHQMGRRAVAEKTSQMDMQGKSVPVRRVVCQNHRNSNCEWMVVLEESMAVADQYTVLSLNLLHSKECLETCNFNARKKEASQAMMKNHAMALMQDAASSNNSSAAATIDAMVRDHHGAGQYNSSNSLAAPASLLVDDVSKYQLTHEMRWSTGKDATKAISDFALVVQRKRSKLCKKNNGGSNKKYVCSDEKCLWFVQLVKGWKSKNWKISAMNLKHSENCTGQAKPTARQLAEMRFFRQAVITHSKSSGKLLTDSFLLNSESGIKIPRGMAYRAQRLVISTSTDDLTESYKFIPSLLESFAKKNPGSTVAYEKDEQGHFIRSFIMPNASSLALLCMQQVFGIKVINYDNVSYNGCMVLLIGRDGNLKSHVLAFALMPNAEMEHMKWFLAMAKNGGVRFDGCPVFCSHNQNGLLRALAHEARNAKIMFCVRSLIEEIDRDKNIPALGGLEDLIWEMQSQETEEGFLKTLSHLESLNAAAAAFLRSVHPKNWAYYLNRSIRLYKWSSTNADEAIMGSDVQMSDEAPFDLIYTFLAFLMDFIFKKSQLATKLIAENPLLTPGADAVYRRELQESESYTVRLCDEQVAFTWRTGARPKITHRVDLSLRTCTCGQMYQLGIPCRHFIAVSLHFANEGALMDGFDAIYKATTYAEVNRNLRIEIPAAEDLHKDNSILPAVTLKGAKYKKRPRSAGADGSSAAVHAEDGSEGAAGHAMAAGDAAAGVATDADPSTMPPPPKAPRLEFDADVVTGLTELV